MPEDNKCCNYANFWISEKVDQQLALINTPHIFLFLFLLIRVLILFIHLVLVYIINLAKKPLPAVLIYAFIYALLYI